MDTFGIRSDYQPNSEVLSNDAQSGLTYWTPERIALSLRYQWPVYRIALREAKAAQARTVVDVGCGVATKLNAVFGPQYDLYGIDQPSAVEVCRTLHQRGIYLAEDFDRPANRILELVPEVDVIISSDVIEHLVNPNELLEYIRTISSPRTRIVLSTPDRVALHGPACLRPSNPAHVREWSVEEFRSYVESRGFTVRDHRTVLPFSFRPDRMTLAHVRSQVRRRHGLRTTQVLIASRR